MVRSGYASYFNSSSASVCVTTSSFSGNHVMFVPYHLPSLPSAHAIGFMVCLSWLHLLLPEITSWCCLHDFVYHLCLLLTQSAVWLAPNYYFFTLSCWLCMIEYVLCFGCFLRVSVLFGSSGSCFLWVSCLVLFLTNILFLRQSLFLIGSSGFYSQSLNLGEI